MKRPHAALVAVTVIYLGSVIAANYLTTRYGFVPVGFSETATAGTFAAGGALIVRDYAQDLAGRAGVLALILAASLASFAVADASIALASGAAFLIGEVLDMAAYTPLRTRGRFGSRWWVLAVAAGALIGALADTIAFLWIAFGWSSIADAITGQMLGKAEVAGALILIGVTFRAIFRKPLNAASA